MSKYKERFEKLEREMAQLKKDVNKEEEFVPVMELEISEDDLYLKFKNQIGDYEEIGALRETGRLELLSGTSWIDNFDLFQSQGGTYNSEGVEFKGRWYYVSEGLFCSKLDLSRLGCDYIYNLKTATPYLNCHDDNIRRTKQTLTPIIF